MRALAGREKALGLIHTSILITVNNLANLYADQGKLEEVERMYKRALAGFQHILSLDNSPPKAAIRGLAEVLYRSMRRGNTHSPNAQSMLADLILLIKNWRHRDIFITNYLASAFVVVMDEKNAKLAFGYSISHQGAKGAQYSGVFCNHCTCGITVSMGRHVCRKCPDVDLCDSCWSKHSSTALLGAKCRGHDFFHVETTHVEEMDKKIRVGQVIAVHGTRPCQLPRQRIGVKPKTNSSFKIRFAAFSDFSSMLYNICSYVSLSG